MAEQLSTRVITPEAILSYPHLEEPEANDQGVLFYNTQLVFLSDVDLTPLKNAVYAAAQNQFGSNVESQLKKLRLPFRTDWEAKGYPEGSTFFSCKTKSKPGIVGLAPGSDGRPAPYQGEIYPGLIVRASINAYFYKQQGGGIGMGLGNIQVIRDGERLDNRVSAEDEFTADANASPTDAGTADLDALM